MDKTPFLTDVKELQRRAREHVEQGAVTPAYRGDVETAVKILNDALATEILAKEEEHADDLATLLDALDPREPTEPITTKH